MDVFKENNHKLLKEKGTNIVERERDSSAEKGA
jgi:hypothetical protein